MAKVHSESAGMNLRVGVSSWPTSRSRVSSHLDDEALRLAEGRVRPSSDARSRDQRRYIGYHVPPRRIEDEPIDWLVEVGRGYIGADDKKSTEDGKGRSDSFSDLDGTELSQRQRHGRRRIYDGRQRKEQE